MSCSFLCASLIILGLAAMMYWRNKEGSKTLTPGTVGDTAPSLQASLGKHGADGKQLYQAIIRSAGVDESKLFVAKGRDGKLYVLKRGISQKDYRGVMKILVEVNARLKKMYMRMSPGDTLRPQLRPFIESKISHVNMSVLDVDVAAFIDPIWYSWTFLGYPMMPDNNIDTAMHLVCHELAHMQSLHHFEDLQFFYAFKAIGARAIAAGVFNPSKLNPKYYNHSLVKDLCQTDRLMPYPDQWESLLQTIRGLGNRFGTSNTTCV